jgi:hypothetical protein
MRTVHVLLSIVLLSTGTAGLTAQNAKPKAPKKGDVLIIKGCLRGSAVEGAQTMTEDAEGEPRSEDQIPTLTYRLQGKKDLLRELKDKHDHMVVQVKGILRSELSGNGLGKDVGRTRITIGVDPRSGRSPHGTDQAVPVLEATSFEGSTVSCGR